MRIMPLLLFDHSFGYLLSLLLNYSFLALMDRVMPSAWVLGVDYCT